MGTTLTVDTYCTRTSPLAIGSEATLDYLITNDRPLVEGIVTHNETREKACP